MIDEHPPDARHERIKKMRVYALALALAATSCNSSKLLSSRESAKPAPAPSRFVLLQGQRTLAEGGAVPVVLRMDATTGETWILNGAQQAKWVGVLDDLRSVTEFDAKGKMLKSGVMLPDGRYLNELSREELIRYLTATVPGAAPPENPYGPKPKK